MKKINKNNYYLCFYVIATIIASTTCQQLYAQFEVTCNEVLRDGVFNTTIINSNSELTRAFNEYIYSAEFSSHQDAIDVGISVGTIVYGVPLQIGGTFTKEQKDEWKTINESYRSDHIQQANKYFALMKFASYDILQSWVRCIEITRPSKQGLNAWIEETGNNSAVLHITWIPSAGDEGPNPIVKGSSIIGGSRSDNSSDKALPDNFQLLSGAVGNRVLLNRKPNENLIVVINTTRGDVSCILPSLAKPRITQFTSMPDEVSYGMSSTLVWTVYGAEFVTIDGLEVQTSGSLVVTPTKSTTYTISAGNNSGTVNSSTIVNVKPPPPVLTGAVVSFRTTNDNKDHDTKVNVYVTCGGMTFAHWNGGNGEWRDNSDSGPFELAIDSQIRKEAMGNCFGVVEMLPNGDDEWHFNWTLTLRFSDGPPSVFNFGSENIAEDRNKARRQL